MLSVQERHLREVCQQIRRTRRPFTIPLITGAHHSVTTTATHHHHQQLHAGNGDGSPNHPLPAVLCRGNVSAPVVLPCDVEVVIAAAHASDLRMVATLDGQVTLLPRLGPLWLPRQDGDGRHSLCGHHRRQTNSDLFNQNLQSHHYPQQHHHHCQLNIPELVKRAFMIGRKAGGIPPATLGAGKEPPPPSSPSSGRLVRFLKAVLLLSVTTSSNPSSTDTSPTTTISTGTRTPLFEGAGTFGSGGSSGGSSTREDAVLSAGGDGAAINGAALLLEVFGVVCAGVTEGMTTAPLQPPQAQAQERIADPSSSAFTSQRGRSVLVAAACAAVALIIAPSARTATANSSVASDGRPLHTSSDASMRSVGRPQLPAPTPLLLHEQRTGNSRHAISTKTTAVLSPTPAIPCETSWAGRQGGGTGGTGAPVPPKSGPIRQVPAVVPLLDHLLSAGAGAGSEGEAFLAFIDEVCRPQTLLPEFRDAIRRAQHEAADHDEEEPKEEAEAGQCSLSRHRTTSSTSGPSVFEEDSSMGYDDSSAPPHLLRHYPRNDVHNTTQNTHHRSHHHHYENQMATSSDYVLRSELTSALHDALSAAIHEFRRREEAERATLSSSSAPPPVHHHHHHHHNDGGTHGSASFLTAQAEHAAAIAATERPAAVLPPLMRSIAAPAAPLVTPPDAAGGHVLHHHHYHYYTQDSASGVRDPRTDSGLNEMTRREPHLIRAAPLKDHHSQKDAGEHFDVNKGGEEEVASSSDEERMTAAAIVDGGIEIVDEVIVRNQPIHPTTRRHPAPNGGPHSPSSFTSGFGKGGSLAAAPVYISDAGLTIVRQTSYIYDDSVRLLPADIGLAHRGASSSTSASASPLVSSAAAATAAGSGSFRAPRRDDLSDVKHAPAIFIKGGLPRHLCSAAAGTLEGAATKKNLRVLTNGGFEPPETGIVGYYDYATNPTEHKCRETEFTRNHWPLVATHVEPLLRRLDALYREYAPVHHLLQNSAIPNEYCLFGTCFSTLTVNRNFRTASHTDKGDFKCGLGVVAVVASDGFGGCYTAVPQLGKAFDLQVGDVLLFDTSFEHGNTEVYLDLTDDMKEAMATIDCESAEMRAKDEREAHKKGEASEERNPWPRLSDLLRRQTRGLPAINVPFGAHLAEHQQHPNPRHRAFIEALAHRWNRLSIVVYLRSGLQSGLCDRAAKDKALRRAAMRLGREHHLPAQHESDDNDDHNDKAGRDGRRGAHRRRLIDLCATASSSRQSPDTKNTPLAASSLLVPARALEVLSADQLAALRFAASKLSYPHAPTTGTMPTSVGGTPTSKKPHLPSPLSASSSFEAVPQPASGCILALPMGFGKTLVGLLAAFSHLQRFPSEDVLIVAPKSVLGHWRSEAVKWADRIGLAFPAFVTACDGDNTTNTPKPKQEDPSSSPQRGRRRPTGGPSAAPQPVSPPPPPVPANRYQNPQTMATAKGTSQPKLNKTSPHQPQGSPPPAIPVDFDTALLSYNQQAFRAHETSDATHNNTDATMGGSGGGSPRRVGYVFLVNPERVAALHRRCPTLRPHLLIIDEGHRIATSSDTSSYYTGGSGGGGDGGNLSAQRPSVNFLHALKRITTHHRHNDLQRSGRRRTTAGSRCLRRTIIFTGTPLQNSAEELYKLMEFVCPELRIVLPRPLFQKKTAALEAYMNACDAAALAQNQVKDVKTEEDGEENKTKPLTAAMRLSGRKRTRGGDDHSNQSLPSVKIEDDDGDTITAVLITRHKEGDAEQQEGTSRVVVAEKLFQEAVQAQHYLLESIKGYVFRCVSGDVTAGGATPIKDNTCRGSAPQRPQWTRIPLVDHLIVCNHSHRQEGMFQSHGLGEEGPLRGVLRATEHRPYHLTTHPITLLAFLCSSDTRRQRRLRHKQRRQQQKHDKEDVVARLKNGKSNLKIAIVRKGGKGGPASKRGREDDSEDTGVSGGDESDSSPDSLSTTSDDDCDSSVEEAHVTKPKPPASAVPPQTAGTTAAAAAAALLPPLTPISAADRQYLLDTAGTLTLMTTRATLAAPCTTRPLESAEEGNEDENGRGPCMRLLGLSPTDPADRQLFGIICDSGKLLAALCIIARATRCQREKVLVFTQYVEVQHTLAHFLRAIGIPFAQLLGSCSTGERERAVAALRTEDPPQLYPLGVKQGSAARDATSTSAFAHASTTRFPASSSAAPSMSHASCRVLIASTRVAAYGLDLTCANHVILLDNWWNPQVDAQAVARAYRQNQTRPVYVYRLAAAYEDCTILAAHRRKWRLFDWVVNGTSIDDNEQRRSGNSTTDGGAGVDEEGEDEERSTSGKNNDVDGIGTKTSACIHDPPPSHTQLNNTEEAPMPLQSLWGLLRRVPLGGCPKMGMTKEKKGGAEMKKKLTKGEVLEGEAEEETVPCVAVVRNYRGSLATLA